MFKQVEEGVVAEFIVVLKDVCQATRTLKADRKVTISETSRYLHELNETLRIMVGKGCTHHRLSSWPLRRGGYRLQPWSNNVFHFGGPPKCCKQWWVSWWGLAYASCQSRYTGAFDAVPGNDCQPFRWIVQTCGQDRRNTTHANWNGSSDNCVISGEEVLCTGLPGSWQKILFCISATVDVNEWFHNYLD